ncbi:MAG: NAD(P)/FAD-dependent oxidoreductase [Rhodospirillales bacterium]
MDGSLNPAAGPRRRVAVIGAGIAGLSAAWLLARRHDVVLYERDGRLGGHANTVTVALPGGSVDVDTGFIVYNEPNYPNLTALFRHLGVATQPSDMSFAASLRDGRLEYAGSARGLFAQPANAVRPRTWRMVADLLRFYRKAPDLLAGPHGATMSLGEYLARERYSAAFVEDHLLPMGAAIWSTPPAEMLRYPAAAFVAFWRNHGLLRLTARPPWRTVTGGSRAYVARLAADTPAEVRLGARIARVRRTAAGVVVEERDGRRTAFDRAVIATHADEALALLADPSVEERRILGAFRCTANRAVLHSDPALMPRRRRLWSSWNFIGAPQGDPAAPACVSYWMNRLQRLPAATPLIVTLNPVRAPDPALVHAEFDYGHPFYDSAALAAQGALWRLQGARRTWYCGSYFGDGFHEDALAAGLAAGEAAGGVAPPWTAAPVAAEDARAVA